MRRLLFSMVLLLCGFTLTGCVQLASLTEEESDIIANYMADTVLKYDEAYEEALVDPSTLNTLEEETAEDTVSEDVPADNTENTPDVTGTKEGTEENSGEAGSNIVTDLSKLIGNDNFEISYSGYELYDSYPSDNNYFSLDTSSDRKLLVITFKVKNKTDKTQNLDLIQSEIVYALEVNSEKKYNPKLTLMFNDLQYIQMDIPAGETKEAVLVFDVLHKDMSEISLTVTNMNKSAVINLK